MKKFLLICVALLSLNFAFSMNKSWNEKVTSLINPTSLTNGITNLTLKGIKVIYQQVNGIKKSSSKIAKESNHSDQISLANSFNRSNIGLNVSNETTLNASMYFVDMSGDFRSKGTGPAPWDSASSWEIFNGTTWVNATSSYPGQSSGSYAVTIQNGHTITINGLPAFTTPQQLGDLTINGTLKIGDGSNSNQNNITLKTNYITISNVGSIFFDGKKINLILPNPNAVITVLSGGLITAINSDCGANLKIYIGGSQNGNLYSACNGNGGTLTFGEVVTGGGSINAEIIVPSTNPVGLCGLSMINLSGKFIGSETSVNYKWKVNGTIINSGTIATNTNTTSTTYTPPTSGQYLIAFEVTKGEFTNVETRTFNISSLLDYANLQSPSAESICQGQSMTAYGQVYEGGLTNTTNGQAPGIVAEFGYSYNTTNSNPATWTNWSPALFNAEVGNNDEYRYTFTPTAIGTYDYTFRYSLNGCEWQYGGYPNGFWNGSDQNSGVLIVLENHSLILSSGNTNQTVCPNTPITDIVYAFGGGATSTTISPQLPSGLNFNSVTGTISGSPTQSGTYNYTISTIGNSCTSQQVSGTITVKQLLDYANLQFPGSETICVGGNITAYGQVYEPGLTDTTNGQALGIVGEFGYNISNSNPATWSNWSAATFNIASGGNNNDEYQYTFTPPATGNYYYTFRYSLNGCDWQYGGFPNGFWDGSNQKNGVLTVLENHTLVLSSGDTNQIVCPNTPITDIVYAFGGGATSATISPALPTGLNFNPNTGTISGTPTQSGIYNYTVTTVGNSCTTQQLSGTVTVKELLDYANLQFPGDSTICEGGEITTFGRIYEPGLTPNTGNPGSIVDAEFGYGSDPDPLTWTNWSDATYNVQVENDDEYKATFGSTLITGTYYYTFRYSLDGCEWQYGGYTASGGGFLGGVNVVGELTVNEAPIITTTYSNLSVNNDLGQCGAIVNYTDANATGVPTLSITYSNAPGSFFPVGTTTVTVTATNSCGSDTKMFNVTVTDTEPPGGGTQFAPPAIANNIPEAANYSLVYELNIPGSANWNTSNQVPYVQNNAAALTGNPFTRVAYLMELDDKWVWVSFDQISQNYDQIGIPADYVKQQAVSNMNVFASVNAGVTTGENIQTGNVEFWSNCYVPAAGNSSIPSGNINLFDFNDKISGTDCYGSFQVHNYVNAETLFAFNSWSNGSNCDLGIGNRTTSSPDWTFAANANSYSTKKIYVLVLNNSIACNDVTLTLDQDGQATLDLAQVNSGGTDNCGVATSVLSKTTFDCSNIGENTVTLTITDIHGNSSTCTSTVTVQDNIAPVVPANGSSTVSCIANAVPPAVPDATDNCGNVSGVLVSTVDTPNPLTCEGTRAYTYSYSDDTNTVNWTYTYTIEYEDFTAPSPTSATVACYADIQLPSPPSVSDNCGVALSPSGPVESTVPGCEGDITYTWAYTDCEGNTHDYVHTVTIERLDFTIGTPDGSSVVNCASLAVAPTLPTVNDNCNNVINPSGPTMSGTYTTCEGTIIYTYTYTDCEGNNHDWKYTYTVTRSGAPSISNCPTTVTVDTGVGNANCSQTASWTPPTATTSCGESASVSSTHNPGATFPVGTTPVTYTFMDCTGISNTCTFNVVVIDTTPPVVITQNITVNLNAAGTASITAAQVNNGSNDNCTQVTLVSVSPNSFSCADVSAAPPTDLIISEYVEGSSNNKYIELYNGTGASVNLANYRLKLYNNGASTPNNDIPLSGTLVSNTTIVYKNSAATIYSGSATSNAAVGYNGNDAVALTKTNGDFVDIFGRIGNDPGAAWTGTGSYTTLDKTLRRKSSVKNGITVNPTGTGPTAFTTLTTEWDQFNIDVVSGLGIHTMNTGGVPVTLTVSDANGNSATGLATVTVLDLIPPVLTPAPNQNVTISSATNTCRITIPDVRGTATDNCAGTVITQSPAIGSTQGSTHNSTINVTVTATDASGNTDVKTVVLTAKDITPPVLTPAANQNVTLNASCQITIPNVKGTATDNCAGTVITQSPAAGTLISATHNQVVNVTVTATDLAGLTDVKTVVLTPKDLTAPTVITQNITIPLDASGNASITPSQINNGSTDNCGIVNLVSVSPSTFTCADVIASSPTDLIISEYIEGSSNNKAIEIYNGTGAAVNLTTDGYVLKMYFNGSSSPSDFALNGTITAGDVFVFASSSASAIILAQADQTTGSGIFNGDDAVALFKGTTLIDVIGQIGLDPGTQWGSGLISTEDNTIRRKSSITFGDSNGSDAFNPASEWDGFATDDFSGLGSHGIGTVVTLTVNDGNGNTTIGTAFVTVIDNIAPVITCIPNSTRNTDPRVCKYTTVGTEFDATFTDNCADGSIANDYNNAASLAGAVFQKGATIVTWTVNDGNGQTATCTTTITVEDNEDPVIACIASDNRDTDPGECDYTIVGTEFDAAFTDNCADGSITNDYNNASSLAGAVFQKGATVVTWTVNDGNGQSTTCTTTITVEDNEAPVVNCLSLQVQLDEFGNGSINNDDIDGDSTDNCGITSLTLSQMNFTCDDIGGDLDELIISEYVDGTGDNKWIEIFNGTGNEVVLGEMVGSSIVSYYSLKVYYDGSSTPVTIGLLGTIADRDVYKVSHTNADEAGSSGIGTNLGTPALNFDGNDAIALTHNGTAVDIIGVIGSVGPWTNSGVSTDNSTLIRNVDVLQGNINSFVANLATEWTQLAQNTYENLGGHTIEITNQANNVILTVTDTSGNVSTCEGNVTVVDLIAPVAMCQNVTVYLDANGNGSIAASSVDNGSSDACGIASLALSQTDFTCSDVGTNEVTLTVTDRNGNMDTCTATVTVVDEVDPTVITRNITVQLDANGNVSITAAQIDNGSSDACGILSTTVSPNSFDCSNVGENTVTLTVTDNNSNVATATATITVEDNVAPDITQASGNEITVDLDANGTYTLSSANIEAIAEGATDACGIAFITVYDDTFTCADVGLNTITFTVTDVNDNTSISVNATVIVTGIVPTVNITQGPLPEFCQGAVVVLTANTTQPQSDIRSYAWSGVGVTGPTDEQSVNVSGNGTYMVTVTSETNCSTTVSYTVTGFDAGALISSYTILANDDVYLHGNNLVQSGAVGATSSNGLIKLHQASTIVGRGQAANFNLNQGSTIGTQVNQPANPTIPAFVFNTQSTASSPDVTVNNNQSQTLGGSVYDVITIKQGATVTFTQPNVFINEIKTFENATISFTGCTNVYVNEKFMLARGGTINTAGENVVFYVDADVQIEQKSNVRARIHLNGNEILAKGANANGNNSAEPTYMTGLFIANRVHGNKNVIWNADPVCEPCPTSAQPPVANNGSFRLDGFGVTSWPNPSDTEFNIKLITENRSDKAVIKVFDMNNKLVHTGEFEPTETYRFGKELQGGVYIIKVVQGKDSATDRLIKY